MVSKKKSSPEIYGRILGKVGYRKEVFIADTGIRVQVCPINIARKNGIRWGEQSSKCLTPH